METNMHLSDYQIAARKYALYPDKTGMNVGLIYCALKLSGEAGEFAEKLGKCIRDSGGRISPDLKRQLILELGDILWYVTSAAEELGTNLEYVARENLDKLESRLQRNQLHGSGDNR